MWLLEIEVFHRCILMVFPTLFKLLHSATSLLSESIIARVPTRLWLWLFSLRCYIFGGKKLKMGPESSQVCCTARIQVSSARFGVSRSRLGAIYILQQSCPWLCACSSSCTYMKTWLLIWHFELLKTDHFQVVVHHVKHVLVPSGGMQAWWLFKLKRMHFQAEDVCLWLLGDFSPSCCPRRFM